MKFLSGLCASLLPLLPIAATAADNLPAMASDVPAAAVNDAAPAGWLQRASLMVDDANYRGAADQLRHIMPMLQSPAELESASFLLATAVAHIPGEDAVGLFSSFLTDFPASSLRERALCGLAGALYDRADYAAALELYTTIDPDALDAADARERNFNMAYCMLKFGRYDEAARLFTNLLNTPLANSARFYLAYIDYVQSRWQQALEGFLKVKITSETPACMTPYYLAQIQYQLGNFPEALRQARKIIAAGCPKEYLPEMQRIAGESLYAEGDVAAALPLLTKYVAAVEQPLPSSLYILGKSAYTAGDYPRAIEMLTPVVDGDNAMGQSAYLIIGQSYLQQGNYDAAMLALDRAVKKDFDPQATELASYNYAVASAKGGKVPFGSSVTLFEQFLSNYPDSPLVTQVADYIVNGYLTDNNYGAALAAINRVRRPSDKILAAKQKVLYLHGARQLQAGRPDDAVTLLREARSLGRYSAPIASESALWLGEAYYKKGDYANAVSNYSLFLKETPSTDKNHSVALFDMAYARFALKEFAQAQEYFNKFLASLKKSSPAGDQQQLIADAYNRLGDCRYYSSDFAAAEIDYARAIEALPSAADYPMFQQALMKGLRRDHQGKIAGLNEMMRRFPNSSLVPSAMLETAESLSELSRPKEAMDTYTALAERFPSTPQGRQGALLLAIARLNAGQTDAAIEAYKRVISAYPTSEEARAAADDLKHIYADRGDISSFTRFLSSVPDAPKMEQTELIALQLESVEKASEAGRLNDVVRLGSELVQSYPDSPQAVDALLLLAQAEERLGHPSRALEAYRTLSAKAPTEIEVNRARMGVLRLSRDLGSDESVLEVADQLLASASLSHDDRSETLLAKAIALRNSGKNSEADQIMAQLAAEPSTLPGAKASYYLAQEHFDRGRLQQALTQVNALIDSNTPQEYWLARGFILLSDINRHQGNTFEADEYLRSLRENYPGKEADIFQMIDERLKP